MQQLTYVIGLCRNPQPTLYGGYAGYFRDPKGHLWEIIWDPELMPSSD